MTLAEIGWRAPLFDAEAGQQLRFYAGGYRFADEGVPTVAGPRGRAEMVFDEVPHLWEGSRLSLGAEWQHDEPRGSQGFLTVANNTMSASGGADNYLGWLNNLVTLTNSTGNIRGSGSCFYDGNQHLQGALPSPTEPPASKSRLWLP